jgi:fructosamine-3-kinase
MKNYKSIVRNIVWEHVGTNVQNIDTITKQIQNIGWNHIDNIVKNTVQINIWNTIFDTIYIKNRNSFQYNHLQQYKDNL